jgi:hypothetical protein
MVDAQVSRDQNFHSLSVLAPRFWSITQGTQLVALPTMIFLHIHTGEEILHHFVRGPGKNELEKLDHL